MIRVMRSLRQKETLLQIGLCALVFVGMAVPFKVMVLVEGFTEVRPVNAVPVVVGLLLGPAGAWGCAIGNLIADLFGTFSKASFLGFWGNFLAAYLPYQIWHTLKPGERPNVKPSLNLLSPPAAHRERTAEAARSFGCARLGRSGAWPDDRPRCPPVGVGLPVLSGLHLSCVSYRLCSRLAHPPVADDQLLNSAAAPGSRSAVFHCRLGT